MSVFCILQPLKVVKSAMKKEEEHWMKVPKNPTFEVVGAVLVNDPCPPMLVDHLYWWVTVQTRLYKVQVRITFSQLWDLIYERHRKVYRYMTKLNKELVIEKASDRYPTLYERMVNEGFDFAPYLEDHVRQRIDLDEAFMLQQCIEEKIDPVKGNHIDILDIKTLIDPVTGTLPSESVSRAFCAGLFSRTIELANLCYPDLFKSHPLYTFEFEHRMLEMISQFQKELEKLNKSATLTREKLAE